MVVHSTMRVNGNGVTGKKRTHSESIISSTSLTDILFIGNPGRGKSALLNCVIGEPAFKSGLSFDGSGVTGFLQRKVMAPYRWIDTPGLSDTKKREQAAKEITKALKSCDGGVVRAKIFFVITLEEGRFRPSDILTMTLVLESAPIKYFGIIINKLKPRMLKFVKSPESRDFRAQLFSQLPKATKFLYPMQHLDELSEVDNACVHDVLPADFIKFIFTMPENEYKPVEVKNVKAITAEAEKEMEMKLEAMKKNFTKERTRYIKLMESKLKTNIDNLKQDHARHTAALQRNLDAVKRHTQARILRMQQENAKRQKENEAEKDRLQKRINKVQQDNAEIQRQNQVEKAANKERMDRLQQNNEKFQKQLDSNRQELKAAKDRARQAQREAERARKTKKGGNFLDSLVRIINPLVGALL